MYFCFCSNNNIVENKYKKNEVQHVTLYTFLFMEKSIFVPYNFNILSTDVDMFDIMLKYVHKLLNILSKMLHQFFLKECCIKFE